MPIVVRPPRNRDGMRTHYDDGSKITLNTATVNGSWINISGIVVNGFFMLHKDDSNWWRVYHIGTGYSVGCYKKKTEAVREAALLIRCSHEWGETDSKKIPRDVMKIGAKIQKLTMLGKWEEAELLVSTLERKRWS